MTLHHFPTQKPNEVFPENPTLEQMIAAVKTHSELAVRRHIGTKHVRLRDGLMKLMYDAQYEIINRAKAGVDEGAAKVTSLTAFRRQPLPDAGHDR